MGSPLCSDPKCAFNKTVQDTSEITACSRPICGAIPHRCAECGVNKVSFENGVCDTCIVECAHCGKYGRDCILTDEGYICFTCLLDQSKSKTEDKIQITQKCLLCSNPAVKFSSLCAECMKSRAARDCPDCGEIIPVGEEVDKYGRCRRCVLKEKYSLTDAYFKDT